MIAPDAPHASVYRALADGPQSRYAISRTARIRKVDAERGVAELLVLGHVVAVPVERHRSPAVRLTDAGRRVLAALPPLVEPVRRLTPAYHATLVAIAGFATVPTLRELAAVLGIEQTTAGYRCDKLASRGCLRILPVGMEVTDRGRAMLAAGKDLATSRVGVLPDLPAELPATVALSPSAVRALGVLYRWAAAGRAPTYEQAAGELGLHPGTLSNIYQTCERRGVLVSDRSVRSVDGCRRRLTGLGRAVAEGLVTVVTPFVPPQVRTGKPARAKKHEGLDLTPRIVRDVEAAAAARLPVALPLSPVVAELAPPPVEPAAPPPRPPVRVSDGGREEVAPVPPGLDPNAPRPVRHPAPPGPGQRDPRLSDSRWDYLTGAPKTMGRRAA